MPEIIFDGPSHQRDLELSQLDLGQPLPLKKPRENEIKERERQ